MKTALQQIINKYKLMKPEELHKQAVSGDAEAACELAKRLYMGKGVDKSYELAREWYEAGAEQNHPECCYELGQMLIAGLGGEEDQERAAKLFKVAADAGDRRAMFELGSMYSTGRGVKKNYVKATRYLRLSATEEARALLSDAANWWRPAAEQGIAEGEYQYGVCLVNGYGVPIDFEAGRELIYKAALKDHVRAIDAMSQIYEFGIGVEADKNKALYWKKLYCDITGTNPDDVGIKREDLYAIDPFDNEGMSENTDMSVDKDESGNTEGK